GGPLDLDMVQYQYPIMDQGDGPGFCLLALFKMRCVVDDIVGVPLPSGHRGHGQGHILLVEGTYLPVGVGVVVIIVQHLDLVQSVEEYPAVRTALVCPLYLGRGTPFQVQLDTAKVPFGLYVPAAVLYGHTAFRIQDPRGGGGIHGADPLVQIPAIEEYQGITGRGPVGTGHHLGGYRGIDLGGLWLG